jgi:hypothetical protein
MIGLITTKGYWYYLDVASRYSVGFLTLMTFRLFFLVKKISQYVYILKTARYTAGSIYTSGPGTQLLKTSVPPYGTTTLHQSLVACIMLGLL